MEKMANGENEKIEFRIWSIQHMRLKASFTKSSYRPKEEKNESHMVSNKKSWGFQFLV